VVPDVREADRKAGPLRRTGSERRVGSGSPTDRPQVPATRTADSAQGRATSDGRSATRHVPRAGIARPPEAGGAALEGLPLGRYYRDVRIMTIPDGTTEIQKLIVGYELTGEQAYT
jgi:alkylation response protein AidB-like acyl-CoA dehydrogenase